MKISTMFVLAIVLGAVMGLVPFITVAEDKPDKTTYTLQDMKAEDQQKAQDLIKLVNDTLRDLELAQAKVELAQSKITRVNEVQLPALQDSLRATYKLPKDLWDFNLQTFTFTKKAQTAQK